MYELLYAAHHRPRTTIYRWVQGAMWVLIFGAIGLVFFELGFKGPPPAWAGPVDRIILSIFAVDVALRIITFRPPALEVFRGSLAWRLKVHVFGRLRFMFKPLVLIDLITVLALWPALRVLRALRLLRLAAGLRFFKYSNPFLGALQSVGQSWLLYMSVFGFLVFAVVLGGMSLYFAEVGHNAHITKIADGFWWALVTITTVGYGDISPETDAGRWIASSIMVSGMFTLALFAGVVSTTLLGVVVRLREDQFRMSDHADHIIVCGYDPGARLLLDALLDETRFLDRPELILFARGDPPADVPEAFTWIPGDPTREHELDKVKLVSARAVVVVGTRSGSLQGADATTLLTLFTLRSYIAKHPGVCQRERPIYIIAEILDSENVEHAYTAGADEVVQTTRLGFALMAHSVWVPGSGQVMSRVAAAGAASVFIGKSPFSKTATFRELSDELRNRHYATLIGIRRKAGARVEFNVPDETHVPPGVALVYLAAREELEAA